MCAESRFYGLLVGTRKPSKHVFSGVPGYPFLIGRVIKLALEPLVSIAQKVANRSE
jgi:hypothetical protein